MALLIIFSCLMANCICVGEQWSPKFVHSLPVWGTSYKAAFTGTAATHRCTPRIHGGLQACHSGTLQIDWRGGSGFPHTACEWISVPHCRVISLHSCHSLRALTAVPLFVCCRFDLFILFLSFVFSLTCKYFSRHMCILFKQVMFRKPRSLLVFFFLFLLVT